MPAISDYGLAGFRNEDPIAPILTMGFLEKMSAPAGAIFSKDHRYRYLLWRTLDKGSKYLAVIGLNPSTADASVNDPTNRRCIGFARDWGYSRLYVVNLFAFRATKPDVLRAAKDPIGVDNDRWLFAV